MSFIGLGSRSWIVVALLGIAVLAVVVAWNTMRDDRGEMWATVAELKEVMGPVEPDVLGFQTAQEVDDYLDRLLTRAQSHVESYVGRTWTAYEVPPAVKEATLRLAANLYNYGLKVRRGPLVQTDTFEVELVDDTVFTKALRQDLRLFVERPLGVVGSPTRIATGLLLDSQIWADSAAFVDNLDKAVTYLQGRKNVALNLLYESPEGANDLANGPELVANPDVEQGAGDVPDNWSNAGAATWVFGGYSGDRTLRLSPDNETAEWRADTFAVVGNKEYRWGARVKGTGGPQFFLTVRFFDAGDAFISEQNISLYATYMDWTEVLDFTAAPANAAKADILFRVPASDTGDLLGDVFSAKEGRLWPLNEVYWLYNDNFVAALALRPYDAALADAIEAAIAGYAPDDPNRIEVLNGDAVPVTVRTGSTVVEAQGADYIVVNEVHDGDALPDWQEYADWLTLQSLSYWLMGDAEESLNLYKKAVGMWDGKGLYDKAAQTNGLYDPYKLALVLFVSQVYQKPPKAFKAMERAMWSVQAANGGLRTGLDAETMELQGFTNTETTGLALLVYNQSLIQTLQAAGPP